MSEVSNHFNAASSRLPLTDVAGSQMPGQAAAEATQDTPEIGGEQAALLEGVAAYASAIVAKYPQLNESGELNYYFAGSVAAMLLAQTDRVEILNPNKVPNIEIADRVEIPLAASAILKTIARKIGDVDIALTPEFEEQTIAATPDYDPDNPEPYNQSMRNHILYGIDVETPEVARNAGGMKSDTSTGHHAARIIVHGQEFYVPDPKVMFDFKVVHLVEDFELYKDKHKLVNDFSVLLQGLSMLYPREELVKRAHDHLITSPNEVLPYHHPEVSATIQTFFDEIIASDENAPYLANLQIRPERSIGVLSILRNYQTPETKLAIVDFINKNRQHIDQWQVSTNNASNIRTIAGHIREHPQAHQEMLEDYGVNVDEIEDWFKTNPWAITPAAEKLPADTVFVQDPARSDYLTILSKLDEPHISEELAVLNKLMAAPSRYPDLPAGIEIKPILESNVAQTPATRRALFAGLDAALEHLGLDEVENFLYELRRALEDTPGPGGAETDTDVPWYDRVSECFNAHGILFQPEQPTAAQR
jgi:hypothetical protein